VQRVVFTSSVAAVGYRWDDQPANEQTRFNLPPHQFPYGYSKLLAEDVVAYAVRQHGQDVVIVNPAVIMGPGDLNLISGRFITEVARRSWMIPVTPGGVGVVDVRDVARWHVRAAETGTSGERYILGTANYSYRQWYAMIARVLDVPRPFIPLPGFALPLLAWAVDALRRAGIALPVDADQVRLSARSIFFDYDKAWSAFGPPQVDMYSSLRDTYQWYAENGYLD
jgi:dihydroflavonol-4-reductase